MISNEPLSVLYQRLQGDRWRLKHTFSQEILEANALLHNPAAMDDEICECLWKWCQHFQPCQFGRISAKEQRIHFCVLRESALTDWTDADVAEAITESKKLWKQRAVHEPARAAHSFVLIVTAPRVAIAAPDSNLRAFADRLLQLSGWAQDGAVGRRRNTISSDYLYLRNPTDGRLYGFQFNVDFFACAADRRWWHDHRLPGGIAFTANSTGHMRAYREWYGVAKGDAREWTVKQAMLTISNAAAIGQQGEVFSANDDGGSAPTSAGRVTWLRPLDGDGRPFLPSIQCPLSRVPKQLENKDWTRYEGFLHTDHAVREEFFLDRETPPTRTRPYLMDFTYLYDERQADFAELTAGKPVTEQVVLAELGEPSTWVYRRTNSTRVRTEAEEALVAEQLTACDRWQSLDRYAATDD